MRIALAIAAALLLAGCGGTVGERAAAPGSAPVQLEPAPPITAVDEPAPDAVSPFREDMATLGSGGMDSTPAGSPDSDSAETAQLCLYSVADNAGQESSSDVDGNGCGKLTPEALAAFQQRAREWQDAVRPAQGTVPRTVARLALGADGHADFTVWRNARGELCTLTEVWMGDGGGGGGPSGPCASEFEPACESPCLESEGGGSDDGIRFVLSGLVPADADVLRITVAGGSTRAYPLAGPVVAGSAERIFMVELGPRDWRRLELLHGDRVVATRELPPLQARFEDCQDQLGPAPELTASDAPTDTAALDAYTKQLNACVQAGVPLSLGGAGSGPTLVPAPSSP